MASLFNFFSNKQTTTTDSTPLIEKVDDNIYAVNAFQFESDNKYLPSDYTNYYFSNGYIRYGADNLFPNKLIDLYYSSPLHKACVDLKTSLLSGDGYIINDTLNPAKKASTELWLDNISGNKDVTTLINELSTDLSLFGNYYLLITWNAEFTKIVKIERLPAFGVRLMTSSDTNDITEIFYCKDWKFVNNKKSTTVKKYPAFNILERSSREQVYVGLTQLIDNRPYVLPNYTAALNSIAANAAISLFQVSIVDNSFNPGMSIKFFKKPSSPEEKAKIVQGIKSEYAGKRNSGKVLILFSDGKELAPEIAPIETSQLDKQYTVLETSIENSIVYGHGIINPALVGIQIAGKLGNTEELKNSFLLQEKLKTKNERKLIENGINKFIKLNGLLPIEIKDLIIFEEQVDVVVANKENNLN